MAAGIPVVAANACGPAELIESGRSGVLVSPEDAGAAASAVAELALDARKRESLGSAARERVQDEFAIDSFNQRLSALYSDVLGAGAPS
jgi:phosphatidylinositol alpha 1,6-mannosyltransferase